MSQGNPQQRGEPVPPPQWLRAGHAPGLKEGAATTTAWAPGRLDVIGGGARMPEAPAVWTALEEGAWAAVQPRHDDHIVTTQLDPAGKPLREFRVPLPWLREMVASGAARAVIRQRLEEYGAAHAAPLLAWILYVARRGGNGATPRGFSCVASTTLPEDSGLAGQAAMWAALCLAVDRHVRGEHPGTALAREYLTACRCLCELCTPSCAVLECLAGEPDRLGCLDPLAESLYRTPLPPGVALVALDTHEQHPRRREKIEELFVTSLMGARLIRHILEEQGRGDAGSVRLSAITPEQYVRDIRDRLPTKLRGSVFLDHFGPLDVAGVRIDPAYAYRVRARTEHHIYEHVRARQFFEGMARASREGAADSLLDDLGALMYASHWSNGQRCGLGTVATDLISRLCREQRSAGIYGAKVAGDGGGGSVTVLLRDHWPAWDALDTICETFDRRMGRRPTLYRMWRAADASVRQPAWPASDQRASARTE